MAACSSASRSPLNDSLEQVIEQRICGEASRAVGASVQLFYPCIRAKEKGGSPRAGQDAELVADDDFFLWGTYCIDPAGGKALGFDVLVERVKLSQQEKTMKS